MSVHVLRAPRPSSEITGLRSVGSGCFWWTGWERIGDWNIEHGESKLIEDRFWPIGDFDTHKRTEILRQTVSAALGRLSWEGQGVKRCKSVQIEADTWCRCSLHTDRKIFFSRDVGRWCKYVSNGAAGECLVYFASEFLEQNKVSTYDMPDFF